MRTTTSVCVVVMSVSMSSKLSTAVVPCCSHFQNIVWECDPRIWFHCHMISTCAATALANVLFVYAQFNFAP